jgi:hypothetical protein
LDQFYSVHDGGCIFGGSGCLETKFEVIQKREKIRKDRLVCITQRLLFFTNEPLSAVFEISPSSKKLIFKRSDLRGRLLGRGWTGGRN